MKEYRVVSVCESRGAHKSVQVWLQSLANRGCKIYSLKTGLWHEISFPTSFDWEQEVAAHIAKGIIESDYVLQSVERVFTDEEIEQAPFFWLNHTGKIPDVPPGPDGKVDLRCVIDVDASSICNVCGAGAKLLGPLRIAASSLNSLSRFSRVEFGAVEFLIVSKGVVDALGEAGLNLPIEEIKAIGRASLKEKWYRIVPAVVIPSESVKDVRLTRRHCKCCGESFVEQPTSVVDGYHVVVRSKTLEKVVKEQAVLCPLWDGQLVKTPGGEVQFVPWRRTWIGGSTARVMMKMKLQHISYDPILWA